MRAQKRISGILAVALCLCCFLPLPVRAEAYWPSGPEVQSEAAIVMEASTGAVLYEKNPHEQLYPASITKIMTTLLALENNALDEEVIFSHDAVYKIDRNSTHIFRDVGEVMTLGQCLYAVMLGSANDCAYAVAEHVGNGYEHFIDMMNEKAKELGCTDTHFSNPHGLPDEQHYTSPYDMALISRAALENNTFRMITGTKRYTIPYTNKHPDEETYLVNHHKMLTNYQGDTSYLYDYCIGGKNGYTALAKNTLVTFAEKDDMELICVVMKAEGDAHYTDTRSLLDYCFDNFAMWNVADNEDLYEVSGTADTEVFGETGNFVGLDQAGRIVLPKAALFEDAHYEVVEKTGDPSIVAAMEYTYAGHAVGSVNIQRTNVKIEPYVFHEVEEDADSESVGIEAEAGTGVGAESGNEGTGTGAGAEFGSEPAGTGAGAESGSAEAGSGIEARSIIIGVAALLALVAAGFLIYFLASHFYTFRRKVLSHKKPKSKYKTIKEGKHSKWRSRW